MCQIVFGWSPNPQESRFIKVIGVGDVILQMYRLFKSVFYVAPVVYTHERSVKTTDEPGEVSLNKVPCSSPKTLHKTEGDFTDDVLQ